jgi:hypothetical protein
MICVESVISFVPNSGRSAKEWGRLAPPFLVGPRLIATSSPCIKLSKSTPVFGHHEDMYGFWSVWCFSVIRCSWNGRSTKLIELISNRHLFSTSCMKCRYVGTKYMHFMTANCHHLGAPNLWSKPLVLLPIQYSPLSPNCPAWCHIKPFCQLFKVSTFHSWTRV